MSVCEVRLWGRTIGAASLGAGERVAAFEYDESFRRSGIELAPLVMPLSGRVYRFPELASATFHGLPGMLADALPDRFGRRLIDAWLEAQGRPAGTLDPIERLCYVGTRAMGALEFHPVRGPRSDAATRLHVAALVDLAAEVVAARSGLGVSFADPARTTAVREILRVGTSAGGARAKAVIVWNPRTDDVRSGQGAAPDGYTHWLLKFDGVGRGDPTMLDASLGYGALEYAYALMAAAAGIDMPESRLLEEGGRRHFMVRRFDRPTNGGRLHMTSLGALRHLDFNEPRANSYEQAFIAIRALGLGSDALEEQYRRMVFNLLARNQDDHVKNIAFLMDRAGTWALSPAFDLTYAYNPDGAWTHEHQMSAAGKRDGFTRADLEQVARSASLKRGRAGAIHDQVHEAVSRWPAFAEAAGVREDWVEPVARTHRLALPAR